MFNKKYCLFLAIGLLLPLSFAIAQETTTNTADTVAPPAGLLVSPQVIDIETKARDILEYTITLENKNPQTIFFYTLVNDLTADGKIEFNDPTDLDKAVSLARWIRVKRGETEIEPGAKYELPLRIEVSMNAKPGTYHAAIAFSPAGDADAAKRAAETANLPTLLINAKVGDESIEKAEPLVFRSAKNVYLKMPVSLTLGVNNIGNVPITPRGTIIIYDRRGREVDSLKVNEDKKSVAMNGKETFVFDWKPTIGKSLGKYKAKADIEYGEKSVRDLSDSTYFWILPLPYLILTLLFLLAILILLTTVLFRRTYHRHHPVETTNGIIDLKNKR